MDVDTTTPDDTTILPPMFPPDSPWRQRIDQAPVAANSGTIMAHIVKVYGNQPIRPDFGLRRERDWPMYGIPYNIVRGRTARRVTFVLGAYAGESDMAKDAEGKPVPIEVPMPDNVVIEGDLQSGPNPNRGDGDSHLLIWDIDDGDDGNVVYEFHHAARPGEKLPDRWYADQLSAWKLGENHFRPIGWTSADAAGLPILPGLARPDEGLPVSQGGKGVIDHAIRVTLKNWIVLDKFVFPASHAANPGMEDASIMPPMGARFRLKASVDITGLNPQSRVIAQAMKTYGLILADNGENFFFSGSTLSVDAENRPTLAWDNADIHDSVRGMWSLKYDDFEVVDLSPAVTKVEPDARIPGQAVDVIGRGFSGSAGRLKVFFGTVESPKVEHIGDGRLMAVVPAGRGSVAVRVQSGVSPIEARNSVAGPIFGYGRSPLGPQCVFRYGGDVANPDPVVAASFVASDSPAFGDWQGVYGASGHAIAGDTTSLPDAAKVVISGAKSHVWQSPTADPRMLQKASGDDRVAACWFEQRFQVEVGAADGVTRKVTLHIADWDRNSRVQGIDVIDTAGGILLDSRIESGFAGGRFLTWEIRGRVRFAFTRIAGWNAILNGLFLDDVQGGGGGNAATFIGVDVKTGGSWQGVHGAEGHAIAGLAPAIPAYADFGGFDHGAYTWAERTDATAALQRPGEPDRIAACWHGNEFTHDVATHDGKPHRATLYFLDWKAEGRSQRIDVIDAITGALLDTRTVDGFPWGKYLAWEVTGHVQFVVTRIVGWNAVTSGVFFDPVA